MSRRDGLFSTVRTEGGLLPTDLLALVAQGDKSVPGISPGDYHLAKGEPFGTRITDAWNRLRVAWKDFSGRLAAMPDKEIGTTVTRDRWLLVLFEVLGYGWLPTQRALTVDGKDYPISHGWGNVPIHLVSARLSIDRRSAGVKGAAGASPHSMVQELLNRSDEHLWAFVSNGRVLRLLRDNASLTRQAYVEFDLEAMFSDEVYEDFVVLWRTCHQSRVEADNLADCWLEQWTKVAAETGTRARDDLRGGVEAAIEALGTGFVAHPANTVLKERLRSGDLDPQDLYRQLLRVIYRLLFLFVAEDRNLLHPPDATLDAQRRYARFYSLNRIRSLAARRRGGPHPDLWSSLTVVFHGLGQPDGIPALALPGLGSFLWSDAACPDLDRAQIANQHLLAAVRHIGYVEDRNERVLRPIDYRNLGTEELGAIYESLLEQHPEVNTDAGTFNLNTAAGNERKTTGSYYTPTSLITELLDSAVDPVLDDAVAKPDPESALLGLSVIDCAAGSGHFLISAAHRIAKRLAAVRTGDDEPSPDATRTALRDVIAHCIYGIDLNPMAVELCKVSLWMESMEPGKPLGFLDHRIVRGNGLIGATPELLDAGVPDDAFKPLTGDDKAIVTGLKKRNKHARSGQQSLFAGGAGTVVEHIAGQVAAIDNLDDIDLAAIETKARRWTDLITSPDYQAAVHAADTWCAAFVAPKTASATAITHEEYATARDNPDNVHPDARAVVEHLAEQYAFLHWHLAFPDVHTHGGFDLVLGNPPFLNQLELASALDARAKALLGYAMPGAIAGYTDLSAVFLAVWAGRIRHEGRIAMVQPVSLLAARDAGGVRATLSETCLLESLWLSDTHMFDASVFVCVPALRSSKPTGTLLRRFKGEQFTELEPRAVDSLQDVDTWAVLMSESIEAKTSSSLLGEFCSITADFRDQYYGLIPFVKEDDGTGGRPRLLTTGLVDPAHVLWGETHTRFGKQRWDAPVVDTSSLHAEGSLSHWATSRLVPKLVVASQTKVIEAVVDDKGQYLPSVPLLTLVPHDDSLMWHLLAVLLSPYASHWAYSNFQGAGMNTEAIKVSAKQLTSMPMPSRQTAWDLGARHAEHAMKAATDVVRDAELLAMARAMNVAYGVGDDLLLWWAKRLGVVDVSA